MKFLYDKLAGDEILNADNEAFLHLKARRVKVGERINVRNLKDGKEYLYEILQIGRKSASLKLNFISTGADEKYDFTLAW
ncbi:MAG: 16S rRNA (uracil(1498)-N(3))-methyltransferase, partial [Campylobacter sp.]|nr:16S rRNA (uracil(1498)-N(3))-methyltransferase [Campylobacter sp.]